MKAILPLLMFVSCAFAGSPEEFLGVKFGSTAEQVAALSNALEATKVEATAEKFAFTGGTLAGRPLKTFSFYFEDGRFVKGAAALQPTADYVKQFRDLRKDLTAKYGAPTVTAGEGKDATAVWKFPATLKGAAVEIHCSIVDDSPGPTTKLVYKQEPGSPKRGASL